MISGTLFSKWSHLAHVVENFCVRFVVPSRKTRKTFSFHTKLVLKNRMSCSRIMLKQKIAFGSAVISRSKCWKDLLTKVIWYSRYDKHYILTLVVSNIWGHLGVVMVSFGSKFDTSTSSFDTFYTTIPWLILLIIFAWSFVTFIWYFWYI